MAAAELEATGIASVIVVFRDGGDGAPSRLPGRLQDLFVRSELSQPGAVAVEAGGDASVAPPVRLFPNLGVAYGTVTEEGLAGLRARDDVETVTGAPRLSLIRPRRVRPARFDERTTWGIAALGVQQLWRGGLTGEGVLLGHLDTGVDARHPTLRRAIALFAEFDHLGRQLNSGGQAHDTDDHGTHTAATIAGRPVRGRHVGVAPAAMLASAIVIEGGDVIARVLGGMDWAVGAGIRILTMSLGFRGLWEDFLPLTRILRRRNVLPVFAVGNEGPGTSRSPGNYPEALSVGAMDSAGAVTDFSSSQRFRRDAEPIVPDLVAPGSQVISARPGGGYQAMDGTSMAAPHVAGLAALLAEAKPEATVIEIERAIFASCDRPSGMPAVRANRGIPNAVRALTALTDP